MTLLWSSCAAKLAPADMAIKVLFFASLADSVGHRAMTIESADIQTARDVWEACIEDAGIPDNALVALNMEYAEMEDCVKDGDEVAFFPPVTGG